MNEPFITKLGDHRGGKRIWIEGKRLVDAGFEAGVMYQRDWTPNTLTLTLLYEDDIVTSKPSLVSAKGDKPIIDITGKRVANHFPNCDKVAVTYEQGVITIEGIPNA